MFHAFRNNPITYTDPDGRTDFIYSIDEEGNKTMREENSWGFWEFLHPDKYFVETTDGTRYRANSKETVELYDWNEIDNDFIYTTFSEQLARANAKETDFNRVLHESIKGELDFKNYLDKDKLYLADGILYNPNEIGNFIWTYFLYENGYGWMNGILAQAGSLFGYMFSDSYRSPRFDEWHDVKARHAGKRYYKINRKKQI